MKLMFWRAFGRLTGRNISLRRWSWLNKYQGELTWLERR